VLTVAKTVDFCKDLTEDDIGYESTVDIRGREEGSGD
jgi:hypothetical protein